MSIQTQDKKTAVVLVSIIAIWIVAGSAFLDMGIIKTSVTGLILMAMGGLIYLSKRRASYLTTLIKKYCEDRKRKELEMASVQAAYGRYRLALVEFKLELKNNPNNELLIEIVSLMDELENGNIFFT